MKSIAWKTLYIDTGPYLQRCLVQYEDRTVYRGTLGPENSLSRNVQQEVIKMSLFKRNIS
jgi:hypothetical protein